MKTLAVAYLLLLLSFPAQARGHHASSGLQRSPAVHSFLFAPLHHARPNLRGKAMHHISEAEAKRLHRMGLDNSVSPVI